MIVAFGHQKRTGKNTCAKFFEVCVKTHWPKISVKQRSFASPLKLMAHQLYGWAGLKDEVYYENHQQDKEITLDAIKKSPRTVWIELGYHCRQVYDLTWVRKTLAACPENVTILTDLRYPNEAEYIKSIGGVLIRVTRSGLPVPTDIADTALNGYNKWDMEIQNNGSFGDLNQYITAVAEHLKTKGLLNVVS